MEDKENGKFINQLRDAILKANMEDSEKSKLMANLLQLKDQKVNLMITGATGCGKSSTINVLYGSEVAKVGVGVDPETMSIEKYDLGNLILWDTPGLGDNIETDNRHAKNIINKLNERDSNGNLLIDLVLVILDGSSRDLGTSYELINNVIMPNLGGDKANRILVAINQCDMAMKGRHWNYEKNKPDSQLIEFLDNKVRSVRSRIKEGTGVDVETIYYSAGYKEEGEEQKPYNLAKLQSYILNFTPKEKRIPLVENMNKDSEVWKENDNLKNYHKEIKKSLLETITDCALEGADIVGSIGEALLGKPGELAGKALGVIGGAVVGFFKHFF